MGRTARRGLALHITPQRELMPGVQAWQLLTGLGAQGKLITRTQARTRVVHPRQAPMGRRRSGRHITPTLGHMARPDKPPTPMGTLAVRLSQKAARLRIHSTRPQRKARWDRYKPLLAAEELPQAGRVGTLEPSKPAAATNMPPQTAMSTKILEAVGNKLRGRRAISDRPRPIPDLPLAAGPRRDGDNRTKRADHRPLAVPAGTVGNRERKVPVVRQAVVVEFAVAASAKKSFRE